MVSPFSQPTDLPHQPHHPTIGPSAYWHACTPTPPLIGELFVSFASQKPRHTYQHLLSLSIPPPLVGLVLHLLLFCVRFDHFGWALLHTRSCFLPFFFCSLPFLSTMTYSTTRLSGPLMYGMVVCRDVFTSNRSSPTFPHKLRGQYRVLPQQYPRSSKSRIINPHLACYPQPPLSSPYFFRTLFAVQS